MDTILSQIYLGPNKSLSGRATSYIKEMWLLKGMQDITLSQYVGSGKYETCRDLDINFG